MTQLFIKLQLVTSKIFCVVNLENHGIMRSLCSHASGFRIAKNPISPILLALSDALCALCSESTERVALLFLVTGEVSMSWLVVCALRSDSPLSPTECLQVTPSVGSSWDGPVYSTATYPVTVSSRFKLDLKERATTIEIKPKLAKMAAAEFLFNQCHATASASLLAH